MVCLRNMCMDTLHKGDDHDGDDDDDDDDEFIMPMRICYFMYEVCAYT